jgi:hypothetical protein
MKAKFSLIVGLFAVICLIGVLVYSIKMTNEADKLRTAARALSQVQQQQGLSTGQPTPVGADEQFKEYMTFERDMRRFLRDQQEMNAADRKRQAIALGHRIDEREKNKHLNAGEGLKLKMALIRAMEPDEEKQALQIAELILRYKTRAEHQQAAFVAEQQRDPRFQSYKAREAQIVAEVQAMRSFPAGMSRDEYLRQRLLEARAAIYYTPQQATQQPNTAPATPPSP